MVWNRIKSFFGASETGYGTPHNERTRAVTDAAWSPPHLSGDGHALGARDFVEARVAELVRRDGFTAGALEHHTTMLVGPRGLSLSYQPNAERLGISQEQARELARAVEARWKEYTNDSRNLVDASGRHNWVALQTQAARSFLISGEILGITKSIKNRGLNACMTAVHLISPARLADPENVRSMDDVRAGIRRDKNGRPTEYFIWDTNPRDRLNVRGRNKAVGVKPYSKTGRKLVHHHFDPTDVEQTRGVSLIAAAAEAAKRQGDLSDASLRAAIAQTAFAMIVKSELNYDQAMAIVGGATGESGAGFGDVLAEWQGVKAGFYGNKKTLDAAGTKTIHLLPNEDLEYKTAAGINADYEPFAKTLNREAAKGAGGMSLEQYTGDYSQLSYSGGQLSLGMEQGHQGGRRNRVLGAFCQGVFEVFLEELFIREPDLLPPHIDFYSYRAALCNSTWNGGHRLHPDPVKQARAAESRIENRITTRAWECEQLGLDFDDVAEQLRREQEMLEGIADPRINRSAVVEMPDSDEQEAA